MSILGPCNYCGVESDAAEHPCTPEGRAHMESLSIEDRVSKVLDALERHSNIFTSFNAELDEVPEEFKARGAYVLAHFDKDTDGDDVYCGGRGGGWARRLYLDYGSPAILPVIEEVLRAYRIEHSEPDPDDPSYIVIEVPEVQRTAPALKGNQ